MRRLSRVVAAVTSVAAIALSAGCGEDNPTPSAAPSSPPSETPTSPPTPADALPPSQLPLAREDSRRGAAAFVEYYISTLNHATRTGDLVPARDQGASGCRSCESILTSIGNVYDRDGAVNGGEWSPTPVSAVKSGSAWVVDVDITFQPQSIVRSRGAKPEEYPGGKGTASFTVARDGDVWKIVQWTRA